MIAHAAGSAERRSVSASARLQQSRASGLLRLQCTMLASMHPLASCPLSRSHAAVVDRGACRQPCAPSCSSRCRSASTNASRPQPRQYNSRQRSQSRMSGQQQATAADTQAPTEQFLEASAVLLERLTACEDYIQLAQLTNKHQDVLLHGPLNVYVLLQAARLRHLLESEDLPPEQAAQHLHVMEQVGCVAGAYGTSSPRVGDVCPGLWYLF